VLQYLPACSLLRAPVLRVFYCLGFAWRWHFFIQRVVAAGLVFWAMEAAGMAALTFLVTLHLL
jgi:hypothetical protein